MLAALAAYLYVHQLAHDTGVQLGHDGGGAHPALRVTAAAVGLFGIVGFGPVRLFLPAGLRRHEPLWVLPVGACATALALAVFGYAGVPYHANLVVVIALGALVSLGSVVRRGPRLGSLALRELPWPLGVALLVGFVAVIPLLRSGFPTVIGNGSDAHLAAGTAQFLQHHYPTSFHIGSPINQVPLVWRSKTPIYYAFAAVSSLSGLQPFQALSSLEAVMLGLTLLGVWLLCRDLLGAGVVAAAAAAALVGLDRMVLHTITHPYYNQTWGMFPIPFAIVLSWWAVGAPARAAPARARAGAAGLLALVVAACLFAYPLAAPIPLLALVVMGVREHRDRRLGVDRGGVRPSRWGRAWRGPRSLLWIVPLVAVLVVPLRGVEEKLSSGYDAVVNPTISLRGWGGDLQGYFPEHQFFSLPSMTWLWVAAPLILLGIALALREHPRALRWALGAVFGVGVAAALYFRLRNFGYYFHFKILAFVAPLAVATAVVGLARLRLLGAGLIVGWLLLAYGGARAEMNSITNELPIGMVHLQALDRELPPGSIRLDMDPSLQLWVAEMLPRHRLCSQTPERNSSYPHVQVSRRADYILVDYQMQPPYDRAGPAIWRDEEFRLYRERAAVPGAENCSQRRVAPITTIPVS